MHNIQHLRTYFVYKIIYNTPLIAVGHNRYSIVITNRKVYILLVLVDYMEKEVKTLRKLEDLEGAINKREPANILYDLGHNQERTELLVTYIDEETRVSERITTSPLVKLSVVEGKVLMDITDSDTSADKYKYANLTPENATYEAPEHPAYESGSLAISLGRGRMLGISQFYREE